MKTYFYNIKMFINDGKTLFGNTGVIISLCILIIILYFSYNKCYINSTESIGSIDSIERRTDNIESRTNSIESRTNNIESRTNNIESRTNSIERIESIGSIDSIESRTEPKNNTIPLNKSNNLENFFVIDKNEIDTSKLPLPSNVRLLINGGNLTVNFTLTNTKGVKTPTKFLVVLAQYDSNKKNTGNNKFILSNEYEMTSSVGVNELDFQTNLCKLVDGLPKCQYIFKNVEVTDLAGSLYYYKIGISAVYDNDYNTPLINPYNVSSKDKLFTIDTPIDSQNANYTAFLKSQNKSANKYNVYDNTMSTVDGKYEMIKSELGNYPDNLLIDNLTVDKNLLSDLIDKTMAQGIINIDVKMAEKK